MDNLHAAARYSRAMVRIEPLGVLTLIYHRASGMTHFVAEPVPQILAALDAPLDAPALIERLRGDFDFDDVDAGAALTERLEELVALGLVTRHA